MFSRKGPPKTAFSEKKLPPSNPRPLEEVEADIGEKFDEVRAVAQAASDAAETTADLIRKSIPGHSPQR